MKFNSYHHGLRKVLNGFSSLILLFLLCSGVHVLNRPKLSSNSFVEDVFNNDVVDGGRLLVELESNTSTFIRTADDHISVPNNDQASCSHLIDRPSHADICEFLKANPECSTGGFFDYRMFLFCNFQGSFRIFGYLVLGVWLVALFYLLGNTAADYFCCSLERLSNLLKLPPTVAGVALLPLGNGAPDVFASIAAFMGKDAGDVGLNSVLGGAVFVTCVVVGIVALCVSGKEAGIDRRCFIRDTCFFLFSLLWLFIILVVGKVSVGSAIGFLSIYVIYGFSVAANELLRKHARRLKLDAIVPLLPVEGSILSRGGSEEDVNVYSSLLDIETDEVPLLPPSLPSWMWASNVAIFSNNPTKNLTVEEGPPWGWSDESAESRTSYCTQLLQVLEVPLNVPRKLTIPLLEEETWSKPYAVASATLAPVLLSCLWNSKDDGLKSRSVGTIIGLGSGCILGALAYKNTVGEHPPRRFVVGWVLGGFVMSIVWFYMIANELVALLMAFGFSLNISPSILGLTVLAWGNSMGDLVSNVALAMNGGDGVQIAFSGCYAGPMFNTLVGLGVSMLLGALSDSSGVYKLPGDATLYLTLAFLVVALLWALIFMTRNAMRPTVTMGAALLAFYLIFIVARVAIALR